LANSYPSRASSQPQRCPCGSSTRTPFVIPQKGITRPPSASSLRITPVWTRCDLFASATIHDTQALSLPVNFRLQGGSSPLAPYRTLQAYPFFRQGKPSKPQGDDGQKPLVTARLALHGEPVVSGRSEQMTQGQIVDLVPRVTTTSRTLRRSSRRIALQDRIAPLPTRTRLQA
jgi:hypothetical protein